MSACETGDVRNRYEDSGSGFPPLLIPGGGLDSTIANMKRGRPFTPIEEFEGEYRSIVADLRNANTDQSTGPFV